MAKKVKLKSKLNPLKKPKERKDPRIERVYEEEVEYICPVRGKVKQKVKIKRYKTLGSIAAMSNVVPVNDSMSELEERDDGLSIYDDGADLGIKDDSGED